MMEEEAVGHGVPVASESWERQNMDLPLDHRERNAQSDCIRLKSYRINL